MAATRLPGLAGTLVCAIVLASCAQSEGTPPRAAAKTHTVRMEGMAFQPNTVTVAAGDTIVWVNKDLVPHSATSDGAGFDSRVIQANGSWQTRVERVGEFDYVCAFHPMMKAKIQVR